MLIINLLNSINNIIIISMDKEWLKIRSFNGSQNNAFEELVCQLARSEKIPDGNKFIRVGAPDGGVESYWILENGDEYGWQAKFFDKIDSSQLSQIEKSFKKALSTHPQLIKYYICLSLNLSDPRLSKQKSSRQKFDKAVERFKTFAKTKKRNVDFELWDSSEIFERLTKEENVGKYFFWFNKDELTKVWFSRSLKENIENLGKRYTPELNFELEIVKTFDYLARNNNFKNNFIKEYETIIKNTSDLIYTIKYKEFKEIQDTFNEFFRGLKEKYRLLDLDNFNHINYSSLVNYINPLDDIINSSIEFIRNYKFKNIEEESNINNNKTIYNTETIRDILLNHLNRLSRSLYSYSRFLNSDALSLVNLPVMILIGEAGKGKSHLIADISFKKDKEGIPIILLLGQHFKNDDPWSQVLKLLGLQCTKEQFLGALDSKAQTFGQRIFFIIDALNEGEGSMFWEKYIAGFIKSFEPYKWIGIIISIRSSYEKLLISKDTISQNKAVRIIHAGFEGKEYEASKHFFKVYEIEQPSVPLFIPEFSNPLFLKLFCEGLSKRGLHVIPKGFDNLTTVIDYFIDSVNLSLSRPEKLFYSSEINIVRKSINLLFQEIIKKNIRYLDFETAYLLLENLLRKYSSKTGLLNELISEGVFSKNIIWDDVNNFKEVVYITYERFHDHLYTYYLLENYLDKENPFKSFEEGSKLHEIIKSDWECRLNKNIVDSLSIQLPEKIGKELYEIAPFTSGFYSIAESFITSLYWRKTETIEHKVLDYINEYIIKYEDLYYFLIDTILTLSSMPNHFFNADLLHKNLKRMSMAERDNNWSIYLHERYQYYDSSIVRRILDWTWSDEKKDYLSDESARLLSTALAWFLTSSNRFVRDFATKSLIVLLSNKLEILKKVLESFDNVNDPYVFERLIAISYGCILRTNNKKSIEKFAQFIYDVIFKNGNPPVNILIRDYARGLVEYALYLGNNLKYDKNKLNPPYNSSFPEQIPTKEEVERYHIDSDSKDFKDYFWGQNILYDSVMGFEDFSRYIIGTNHKTSIFSNVNFRKKIICQNFKKKLNGNLKKLFKYYERLYDFIDLRSEQKNILINNLGEKKAQEFLKSINESFIDTENRILSKLKSEDKKIFENDVKVHLNSLKKDEYGRKKYFDLTALQRLIISRVFELGWDVELFGYFDRHVDRSEIGRSPHKPERIGKKYQWIAYHEYLARITDNFEIYSESNTNKNEKYQGTWQLHVRDIDPTNVIKTQSITTVNVENTWWFNEKYNNFVVNNDKWLRKKNDLPNYKNIVEVKDENQEWLLLEGYPHWREPESIKDEDFKYPHKEIWTHIRSYIVKKSEKDGIVNWINNQNLYGRWMPESRDLHRLFSREFYWSNAYKYHLDPFYGYSEWEYFSKSFGRKAKYKGVVTAETYMWEKGYDCSIEETISITRPSNFLFKLLNLRFGKDDKCFYDVDGNVMCQDPSIDNNGLSCLLLNKNLLLKTLNENNLEIIWTILGERLIYGLEINDYLGRMEFWGSYSYHQNKLTGKINEHYIDPPKSDN